METPESLRFEEGNVVCLCRTCPGRQEPNDDSAAVVQTSFGAIVLVVADGVGGCVWGHKASAIAVHSVSESVLATDPGSDLRVSILDGIEAANREIIELGVGAATTITVVEIFERASRVFQVGDSMALIVGQRGALKWKSTAHSPVGYAIESGLMNEREAMSHDERHLVSNLVGSRTMRIEIGPKQALSPRDTVIVGSDGLFDNLHLNEVIAKGRIGKPIDRVDCLAQLAGSRMTRKSHAQLGKPDDLTILLYTA